MVPRSVPGSDAREGELTTSSVEQRTRTFDVVPSSRSGMAGPAPGDVLGNRFVLHQCLADGSTSRLFRAVDRRREAAGDPDPWVVLKVVTSPDAPAAGARPPRALQALRREAAIAQGLEHPNLPRIIGIDRDGAHTFVCMAWIEGDSLAAILDSRGARPMTRVQGLQILEGVGRALAHLHAQGITHADVKPGNILVTAQGHATLLDFGVAVGPGAGDLPAVRGFTPEYASPAVLAGDEPTPADDLFSLACVAYRMLAGHRAFGSVTAREAAADRTRPARPGHLSPAQWRALDRALSFAPAERQPDVATFLAQLKGARDETLLVTDLPAPEAEAEPAARSSQPAPATIRRRPGPLAIGLALAVAVAGVASTFWFRGADDPAQPTPPATPPALTATPPADVVPAPVAPATPAVVAPAPAASEAPAPPVPVREAAPRPVLAAPEPPRPAPSPAAQAPAGAPPAELAGPPQPEPEPEVPPAPAVVAAAATPASPAVATPSVPFSSLTVRRYVEPAYPRNAASRRLAGWVEVTFTVEPSGRTADVQVIGADPPGIFDDAAVAAVRRWRFAGDEDGGAAGPVTSRIRVRFAPEETVAP